MRKNLISKFCYVLLSVTVLIGFTACFQKKPWDYDNVVWYSEDPEIEITYSADVNYKGYIVKDGQTIEVQLLWGPTHSFDIIDAEYELTSEGAIPMSDVTIYLNGKVKYDSDHAYLIVNEDNLFNYKYSTITLNRRDITEIEGMML